MKKILGFTDTCTELPVPAEQSQEITQEHIVRSVVSVRFPDVPRPYSYYNDRFNLRVGDRVHVSGKCRGKLGRVVAVNTRFKIDLNFYERITAKVFFPLHGTFTPAVNMMVNTECGRDDTELFRAYVVAPEDAENHPEFVMGEGYAFNLEHFEGDEDVEPVILQRAMEYCRTGKVKFISVVDGVGTAFVEGTEWYEVNFRYAVGENGECTVSDMYCGCRYPELCKHELAVLAALRALLSELGTEADNFMAVEQGMFFEALIDSRRPITV